jgi:Acetyl-CoA carboxylase, carboxyltransferase component (subunits alpha and beta)
LLDKDSPFFEIGLWAAYKMYDQWGKIPAAGVVTGIGNVEGVPCMIVANDATVKAGAFFPATTKKVIRASGSRSNARSRSFTSSIRQACSCRCRMKFFPMKMISAGSFAITR